MGCGKGEVDYSVGGVAWVGTTCPSGVILTVTLPSHAVPGAWLEVGKVWARCGVTWKGTEAREGLGDSRVGGCRQAQDTGP